jgi:surface protein
MNKNAQEFFNKKFTKKAQGQGTIEYLIILAIVVVIGLTVASLISSSSNTEQINTTTDKIDAQTRGGITVTEGYTDSISENIIVLRNNDPKPLTLKTIKSGDIEKTYNQKIFSGTEQGVKLDEIDCICTAGQTSRTCEYNLTYESENGIEYTTTQEVRVECLEEINTTNNVVEPEYEIDYFRFMITTDYQQEFIFQVDNAIDLEITWGGEETTIHNGTGLISYEFPQYNTDYNVDIKGSANRISFGCSACTKESLKDILTPVSAGVSDINSAKEMFDSTNVESFTSSDFFDEASSNVTDMSSMFTNSIFNQDISNWDTSNVTTMFGMFSSSSFNKSLNTWDVSNVEDMRYMFLHSDFNGNITDWNPGNVKDMYSMFNNADSFNQPIGDWNTISVENMQYMFSGTDNFNQSLNNWDTNNVENMSFMFDYSNFNGEISDWNVENVVTMDSMFEGSSFNQNINDWNTWQVEIMIEMFRDTPFNQPLNNWDTRSAESMGRMFYFAENFNQHLNGWNTSNVTNMVQMFSYSNFNQNISNWDVDLVTSCSQFATGSPLISSREPDFENCFP